MPCRRKTDIWRNTNKNKHINPIQHPTAQVFVFHLSRWVIKWPDLNVCSRLPIVVWWRIWLFGCQTIACTTKKFPQIKLNKVVCKIISLLDIIQLQLNTSVSTQICVNVYQYCKCSWRGDLISIIVWGTETGDCENSYPRWRCLILMSCQHNTQSRCS